MYISNKVLHESLVTFQATSKKLSKYKCQSNIDAFHNAQTIMFEHLLKLVQGVTKKWRMAHKQGFLEQEDVIQEVVLACIPKLIKFDTKYPNAFSYLTTCIINEIKQLTRTQVKEREKRHAYGQLLKDIDPLKNVKARVKHADKVKE